MILEKKYFISQYNKGLPQILKKNLIADIETPFSSLLKISKSEKYSFLLESVEGGSKRGRYSLLGCDPDLIWTVEKGKAKIKYLDHNFDYNLDQKPIHSLKELVKISKFTNNEIDVPFPTLVGYLGYPMIQYIENIKLNNKDNIKIKGLTGSSISVLIFKLFKKLDRAVFYLTHDIEKSSYIYTD